MSVTPTLFAEALLGRLGAPISSNNVEALVAVQKIEGGHQANGAWHNPLNTSQPYRDAYNAGLLNPNIKAYASWDDGVEATARTLENTMFDYSGILSALRRSAPPDETIREWQRSPWGWDKAVQVGPASAYQWYANVVYRGPGTVSRWGGQFGSAISRFVADHRNILIGAALVGGLGLVVVGLGRRQRALRGA